MNYCLPLRYATMGGHLDPEAFWRLTVVNLQDLGTSLTVNLGTSSQDVFAARGGRARPGRLDILIKQKKKQKKSQTTLAMTLNIVLEAVVIDG